MTTTHTTMRPPGVTWPTLTPGQVERLTDYERRWTPGAGTLQERDESLLFGARDYAEGNVRDSVMFGHLGWPEDATEVYPCGERTDGRWSREFVGTVRGVAGVTVSVDGTQYADGSVERTLNVYVDDLADSCGGVLDADQARQLAGLLIEAADELDRLGTSFKANTGVGREATKAFLMGKDGWNEAQAGVLDKIPVVVIAGNRFTKPGQVNPTVWPDDGIVARWSCAGHRHHRSGAAAPGVVHLR